MEKKEMLIERINESENIISDMISKAESQGAKNIDMLYFLFDTLSKLKISVENDRDLSFKIRANWNSIMGWISKVFEGHPILDLLNTIDKILVTSNRLK